MARRKRTAEIDETGLQVDGQAHAAAGLTGGEQGEGTKRKVEPERPG